MRGSTVEPERLVDVRAVADWLGVKPSWVYDQVQQGRLPHIKLTEGCLRFRLSEIEAHIAGHSNAPTGPAPTPRSRKDRRVA